jgi:hypothetical protein
MAGQQPAVFIGSSSEGILVAKEVELQLKDFAAVKIWKNDLFKLGGGVLETLTDQLENFDFAIFVLSPDDALEFRGQNYFSPRDNVLFELGLFMGSLGRGRTFIVHAEGVDLKLPSDLAGIVTSPYRFEDELSTALSTTCTPIIKAIRDLKCRENRKTTDLMSEFRLHSYKCPESEKSAKRQGTFAKCASRSTTAKYLVLRGRDILSSQGEIAAVSRDAGPLLRIQLLMVDFETLSSEKFHEIRQTMDLLWDEDLEAERELARDRLAFAKDLSKRKSGFQYRLLPKDMVPEIKLRLYNHSAFFTFYRKNVGFSSEVQNRPVFCVEDQDPSKYDHSPLRITLERFFDELWDLSRKPS